jgi:hypothetical protein
MQCMQKGLVLYAENKLTSTEIEKTWHRGNPSSALNNSLIKCRSGISVFRKHHVNLRNIHLGYI